MEIPEKLFKFKFYILLAITFTVTVSAVIYFAARFVDILAYFSPLLVSTATFLIAVILFSRIWPLVAEPHDENAVEGLLDYVAGQPEQAHCIVGEEDTFKSD